MLNPIRRLLRKMFGRMDGTQYRGLKPLFTQSQLNKIMENERERHALEEKRWDKLNVPVPVGEDGRCKCTCGTKCALGRTGMATRCTKEELGDAGVPWSEDRREGRR